MLCQSSGSAPFPAIVWLPPLAPPFRFAIYSAFAVLFASGAACLVANPLKVISNGEIWQQAAAYLLMVHGAAVVTLTLRGARFPLHIGRAWSCISLIVKMKRETQTPP
jgi:ABC-type uncharacterized transport system permease subunit